MNIESLRRLLEDIQNNNCSVDEGLKKLRLLPYEDLGFACIDHHRSLRQGFPEVIFCQGKSQPQVVEIVTRLLNHHCDILATRANEGVYQAVHELDQRARYNPLSRTITIEQKPKVLQGKILVVSAGTSDIPVAEEVLVTARILGSVADALYDVGVAGIHRLLDRQELLHQANVIVVVAGMEGALASVVGGLVDKPVIAVPTSIGYGASFSGLAALLTMLNSCASGVAVVNIDNGFGAGTLAHMINRLSFAKG
ncbi:MAG: nickel pincer cofactor biosynthesis protein LarB [Candidatus Schekmanbacteria bacterium]|nr:nickel pincer cofactor biosynthesis protein LarB [Candidatus Schekmanbacteria bacterium]